jgi:hypothetical protein
VTLGSPRGSHTGGADVALGALAELAVELAHQRDANSKPNFGAGGDDRKVSRGIGPSGEIRCVGSVNRAAEANSVDAAQVTRIILDVEF